MKDLFDEKILETKDIKAKKVVCIHMENANNDFSIGKVKIDADINKQFEAIKKYLGTDTDAAAVRYAIKRTYDWLLEKQLIKPES